MRETSSSTIERRSSSGSRSQLLPDYWEDTELTPDDLAEEDAEAGILLVEYAPRVQRAFQTWLHQHTFLWVEGQGAPVINLRASTGRLRRKRGASNPHRALCVNGYRDGPLGRAFNVTGDTRISNEPRDFL